MDRIDDEKMFYLRSRGIENQESLDMMIQSYTKVLYNELKEKEEEFYEQKIAYILSLI
jgi:Fe-S cluster assembly scaffold protein SufB